MSRVICVLVVVLMSAISTVGVCDLTPIEAGEQNAQQDVRRIEWFSEGCFNGCFFIWIFGGNPTSSNAKKPPEVVVKNVPNLLGKPPEYINKYVSAYQTESVRIQVQWVDYGWMTGTGLMAGGLVVGLISRF